MKTILSIFKNDIRSIVTRFFVILIALAMCVLPALYAWINIYAVWDPYVNTGSLEVALASRDRGVDLPGGDHVNRAREVIADVKDSDKACYVPLDDPDDALEGVKSGKYYAAIVFEDGFSYDMEHFEEAVEDRDPKITFYPNIKKNGIATKITTGAADAALQEVNEHYLGTVLRRFFGDTNELADRLDSDEAVEDTIAQLTETKSALEDFNRAIDQYLSSSGDISAALASVRDDLDEGRSKGNADMKKAKKAYKQVRKDLDAVKKEMDARTEELSSTIDELRGVVDALKQPVDEEERQRLTERAEELCDRLLTILQNLRRLIPEDGKTPASRIAAATLDLMIEEITAIENDAGQPSRIDALVQQVEELKKINEEELIPALGLMTSDIKTALKLVKPLLSSTSDTLDHIDPVLESAGRTMTGLDRSMIRLRSMLGGLEDTLDEALGKIRDADEDDRAQVLIDLLGGDPDKYSDFLTSPVEVSVKKFFPAKAYGMTMAPFFTIIALWVGGVTLATLLKTNINRRKFPQATEAQGFFGRFALFFLLGQIQTAVVVAGDIFMLHCEPVHPWLMWLSASVASMVFVLLIYALTLVFGNVGRAAVIVIMVLQIAGSSGTYPIEILPPIFSKIYLFFPFPYAINAMREAMFGLYGQDYLIYLGQLLLFGVIAVLIGLLIRRPFMGVDRYMTEKLEETEVL